MSNFTTASRIIITCPKRLSPFLAQEVEELGFTLERKFITGVELQGTVNDCIRLNLNLRCASQVLFSLDKFTARDPEEVYKKLLRYPWERWLSPQSYFSVTSNVDHFTVNNDMFINVKVKDAIVDQMRREALGRPDSGSSHDKAVFHLFWKDDKAEIFLDTSGQTLAKHGYRKIPGKAPMLEALAAATIFGTKWDKKMPFVNPMCGSGTLAIEAALMAANRGPGLFRKNYSFMHVLGYQEEFYQTEVKKLNDQIITSPEVKIIATDISKDAIEISKVNAGIAGVAELIDFQVCDFEQTTIPEPPGVIYLNPEYGERLGETAELEATYKRIGDFMKKKCQGYTGYIFTGNPDLAKKIGLKTSKRLEFYTAQLECRLLEYEMYGGTRRTDKLQSIE
ncbi:MAG: class I SAM-dependent RNA methyltransferase [Bacteroidetes bacterium]|nr:class I SAM-dependent RNA methyltransferase [Bacteroidota bacterium]